MDRPTKADIARNTFVTVNGRRYRVCRLGRSANGPIMIFRRLDTPGHRDVHREHATLIDPKGRLGREILCEDLATNYCEGG
jgi:hypothetical protein